MKNWGWILLILLALPALSGCVSTGAKAITEPERTAGLAAGKSTKGDVAARLGFPAIVTYGQKGEETWDYYYVTEYPRAVDFVPIVVAFTGSLNQTTRGLTVSFNRQGVVQNLQPSRTADKADVFPY